MEHKKSSKRLLGRSVADVEGPWIDPEFESGLIARCRQHWQTPVGELSDELLATFLRQEIGLLLVIPEAERRVAAGLSDGSEIYDGEMAAALNNIRKV